MGIFSDRCDALIDPNTRKALTGEALEKAKLDPKWPRCGTRVSKAARFCRTCGKTAPGGWWRCPSCRR
jgi:lipopolysaccharide biosynthesis regulator YciM